MDKDYLFLLRAVVMASAITSLVGLGAIAAAAVFSCLNMRVPPGDSFAKNLSKPSFRCALRLRSVLTEEQ